MKKALLTILALVIIMPVIYAHRKKHHTAKGNEILAITMKHGGCYGRCPIYTIDIAKNGRVTYTGIRFVKDSGVFTKNVGAPKVKTLFDQFNAYPVDTCSAVYTNRISDLSGTYYNIVYKNKTQKISNANFGPDFLKELANDVNNIAMVDTTWARVDTTK